MLAEPNNSNYSRFIIAGILVITLITVVLLVLSKDEAPQFAKDQPTPEQPITINEPEPEVEIAKVLPETYQLTVPFTAQAPTANWDELHNEACEEASSIMAYAYYSEIDSLPPATVEAEITKLTKWQQDNYGYYLSITTDETAKMIREVYNLKTEVIEYDEKAIKEALMDDKLVIIPAQGQLLDNPNFTPPGPPYHMLVITGWNETMFITNDPGTRRGENYKYTYDTMYNATGSWNHDIHEVELTKKKIIIVSN